LSDRHCHWRRLFVHGQDRRLGRDVRFLDLRRVKMDGFLDRGFDRRWRLDSPGERPWRLGRLHHGLVVDGGRKAYDYVAIEVLLYLGWKP
jgi:hypothetical protein